MSETPRVGRPSTGTPILIRLPEHAIDRADLIAGLRSISRAALIRHFVNHALEEIKLFTVQIEATADGAIWQAVTPPETAEGDDAQDVAEFVASHQNIAEGGDWRIVVWQGEDADTGTDPAYVWTPPTPEHFTAWITTDANCLAGDKIDVVVLADKRIDEDAWLSTDSRWFDALTTIRVRRRHDADADAIGEATALLEAAGWTITDRWDAIDSGYVATVKRDGDA